MLWFLALPILITAMIGWWWYGRVHPAPIEKIPPNPPGMTLVGTTLAGWEEGKKLWEVRAQKIWRSKDGMTTVFEKISGGQVYTDEEIVHFEAPLARLDQIHQLMTVQGGIQGKLKDGAFSTASVQIDLLQKKMTSGDKFSFHDGNFHVTADKIESDLAKEMLTLSGNVHLKDGQQAFSGTNLVYDLQAKTYELNGDTKAEMDL
jgi:LPS export ABC transporter protein LptC